MKAVLDKHGYDVIERFPPKGWTTCEGPVGVESYTRQDSFGIGLDRTPGGSVTLTIPRSTTSAPSYREAKNNL